MDSINRFLDKIPPLFQAILLLIIAFLVAWLAKAIIVALMRRLHVDERLGTRGMQGTNAGSTSAFVGNLTFLIVFLLFLPSVLDKLDMNSVADPIVGMIHTILSYLPNVIAAALVLYIGHMIARLVGQLLEAVLQRARVDRVQTKLGMTVTAQNSLAHVVGKTVYALIMIFVVIAGLQVLDIHAVSDPAVAMLHRILVFLPLLVIGLVIIGLGIFIGGLVGKLVTNLLSGIGADAWLGKLIPQAAGAGAASQPAAEGTAGAGGTGTSEAPGTAGTVGTGDAAAPSFSLSHLIGMIVRIVIILFFVVEGLQVLQLELLTDIGAAIIGYLPSALAAVVIMVLAVLAGNWIESLIIRRSPANRSYAVAAKVAILVIAVFMTLTQLHLSATIVTIAFLATVGAVAVAFAIAFGVGGRAFAAGRLSKLEAKLDEPQPPAGTTAGPRA